MVKLQILLSSLFLYPTSIKISQLECKKLSMDGLPITCNLAVGLRSTRRYHLPFLEPQP